MELALSIVALVLAGITLVQTKGTALLAWGLAALGLIHLLPAL